MASTSSVTLSIYDYVIFIGTLMVSILIGLYYGCFGSRQSSATEYLMGGKKMNMLPIAISVAVSHFSGTLLLAAPAEVFRYGITIWFASAAVVVMGLVGIYVFLPVLYNLQLTSIYEYLEKRFDRKTRMLAFIFYLLAEIMNFPIHAYSPSLTFATASGLNLNLTAFILCSICIIYTSVGGLKTVVWTDFFQFLIIILSLGTIAVIGFNASGGFLSIYNAAKNNGRLDLVSFDVDLTQRDTIWAYSLGYGAHYISHVIIHQSGYQKFLALQNFKTCVRAVVYTVITFCLVNTFLCSIGLETYALYKACDPLSSKKISKHDQLFPYFITDIAGKVPGIAGLFVATICSASLSSMSSDLNAFSAVVYKDGIDFFLKKRLSKKKTAFVLKMVVIVAGIFGTCLVFAIERLGEILAITMIVSGVTQGPLLGVFTLGLLFPRANANGAFYGTLGGFIVGLAVIIPSRYYLMKGFVKNPTKPLSVSGCEGLNQTLHILNTHASNTTTQFQPLAIFRMSFAFYTLFGALVTIVLGMLISYITKKNVAVDRNLLSPVIHCCLPKDNKNDNKEVCSTEEAALYLLEKNNEEVPQTKSCSN